MKLPRLLSTRLASALILGCALPAFAPLAAAEGTPIVALNDAAVDKFAKASKAVDADEAAKGEMGNLVMMDEEIQAAIKAGKSANGMASTKYPKATALLKAAGYTPDEFIAVFNSIFIAQIGNTEGTNNEAIAKANVAYCKANEAKITAALGQ